MIVNLSVEFVSPAMASETTLKVTVVGEEMVVAWQVLGLPFGEQLEVVYLWNLVAEDMKH
jgi:hypothetical protein